MTLLRFLRVNTFGVRVKSDYGEEVAKWKPASETHRQQFLHLTGELQITDEIENGRLDGFMVCWRRLPESIIVLLDKEQNTFSNIAAEFGHLHILEWLYAKHQFLPNSIILKKVAENGHLEVFKWCELKCVKPNGIVIKHGRLDFLHYLYGYLR